MNLLTELNKCRTLKWGDPDKPGDEDAVVYLCARAADEITRLTAALDDYRDLAKRREWGAKEMDRLRAELDSTKIQYADCARLLEETEGQIDLYKERIQQLFARLTAENAALREELNSITHVATTADPEGWWIAPRGSTDPKEWICVEEMMIKPQCPECGRDSVKEQWVCEHCGHRAAIDGAGKVKG